MKKLLLALLLLVPMLAQAYDAKIDGIYYNLVSETKTAEVTNETGKSDAVSYSGIVAIPSNVTYDGVEYSVTSIGYYAFMGCEGLTSITIPNSLISIGYAAFAECSSMTSISIPNSVISIGDYAFYKCSGLTSITIPNSVTNIGRSAFYECAGLSAITIPGSVTSIGEWAFYNCTALTSFVIPSSVTSIGLGTFQGCSGLTSVTIPSSVTSIGNQAFYSCSGLTSVTISSSVTSIGIYAFDECSSLTSVHISDIAAWCKIQFSYSECNPLRYAHHLYLNGKEVEDLVIPNSVTSIGDYAFQGCTALTSVTIPSSVTSIGEWAFNECSSLTSVHISDIAAWCKIQFSYSDGNPLNYAHHLYLNGKEVEDLVVPNSVTSIGDYAFRGCTALTSVTIPNSVTSIGDFAFYGCFGLTSIAIPNSVTSIGMYAFEGTLWYYTQSDGLVYVGLVAYEYKGDMPANTNIILKEGTKGIGSAFHGCSGLTSITIPNSVTSIGDYAFDGCSGLTSITIPNSVASIGDNAFSGCSGLTSIAIPNSVTSIGGSAFHGCSGLTSIAIPNSVSTIGDGAFYGCSSLTSITIPNSITNIRQGVFWNCTSLTSITIPNSVTSIGWRAFCGCTGLTSITIPNSITIIESNAFEGCTGLTSITIPNSITIIESAVFYGCSGLTSISIPNSVTYIGASALRDCTSLTSITIPNSVAFIDYGTFYGCKNIETVTCLAEKVPLTGSDVFKDVYVENATLIVPKTALAAYSTTEPWSNFGTIKAMEKCATPEISYENGEIKAVSATEGAVCQISYASIPGASGTQTLTAYVKLNVTAYATADGYLQSDEAKATLELGQGATEIMEVHDTIYVYDDTTTDIVLTPDVTIQLRITQGIIHIIDAPQGTAISVYTLDGELWEMRKANSSDVSIDLPRGKVYIVKVGEKTFKVKI